MLPNAVKTDSGAMLLGHLSGAMPDLTPHWFVAQTRAHHARRVSRPLGQRAIENFLPLYGRMSQWRDRRGGREVALFACDVYLHLGVCARMRVLEVPGVARLVAFGAVAAVVRAG